MLADMNESAIVEVPSAARNAARDGIAKRAKERGFWTRHLMAAKMGDDLQLCFPHRFAFLSLEKIRSAPTLAQAMLIIGWRFLIVSNGSKLIAAAYTVPSNPLTGEYRLTELNEGPFVDGTRNAYNTFPAALRTNEFEPLLLIAPAVYTVALGVFGSQRDKDRFVVIPTTKPPLTMKLIDADALLKELKAAAAKVPYDSVRAG